MKKFILIILTIIAISCGQSYETDYNCIDYCNRLTECDLLNYDMSYNDICKQTCEGYEVPEESAFRCLSEKHCDNFLTCVKRK